MDNIDHRILQALSKDGRLTNQALADQVGLSPSATLRRVQTLEAQGVIKGYRAVLDAPKTGVGFIAYVTVGLNDHSKRSQTSFEQALTAAPEVRECHNITGSSEYLLRIEAADLAAYKQFHTDVLGTLRQVSTLTTYVVLGSPKDLRG